MRIDEFLLARVAEDEAEVSHGIHFGCDEDDGDAPTVSHGPRCPNRVLAECEAKRQIVEWHKAWPVLASTEPTFETDPADFSSYRVRMSQQIAWLTQIEYVKRFGEDPPSAPILLMLAQPYADHEDFDPSWLL